METVAAALGIFQGITGIFGSRKQAKIEREKVQLGFEDNLEKIRRRQFQQDQTLGQAKLITEASGITHSSGSTAQRFMDTMAQEFRYEMDWMREYASRARKLGLKTADVAEDTNFIRSIFGGLKTYASIAGASK